MKSIAIAVSLLLSSSMLMAQGSESKLEPNEPKTRYSAVFGTLGLPTGDFAENTQDNFGKAKMGFGVGFLRVNQINSTVSFALEGRFIYNALDISALEDEISGS